MPFSFVPSRKLPDVTIVEVKSFSDGRGSFMETYRRSDFFSAGIAVEFLQDNQSRSTRGVLRGLHYQIPPFGQGKLVRCVRGEILDVFVDVRAGSPTFGMWDKTVLSEYNRRMVYIPVGFAHGFHTISDVADVVYKATAEYDKASERGVAWNDPDVGVSWCPGETHLSDKDRTWPTLSMAEPYPWPLNISIKDSPSD